MTLMKHTEEFSELSPEEIAALKESNISYGCVISIVVVTGIIFGLTVLFIVNSLGGFYVPTFILAAIALFALLTYGLFWLAGKNNREIKRDIQGGRKRVITGAIESKRVDSTENRRRGRNYGKVTMYYFMTVGGKEYKMSEKEYTEIKTGEIMQIHEAPNSGMILRQEWLRKKDGEDGSHE